MAFRALGRNKMRTALTMLGVVIGVGAVICTVAIGEGASQKIQAAIANMGANMVWIEAGGVNLNGVRTGNGATKTLTMEDDKAIEQQIRLVGHITPNVDTRAQVVFGNQNWNTSLRGISPDYLYVRKLAVERGTFFGPEEVDRADNVCVLGPTVAAILFANNEDPIGQTIRVAKQPCKVLGLLEPKGQSAPGQDQDDFILMPYTTVMKKIRGVSWLNDIWASAVSPEAVPEAEREVTDLLRERHHIRPGQPDDFNIRHPEEIANAVADSARLMELLLASIASNALVVGGIGIMNIMGGIIGLVFGLIGAAIVAQVLQWPTAVPVSAMILAVVFSACVGIFFGYYPAKKAANLDPIEALRYE